MNPSGSDIAFTSAFAAIQMNPKYESLQKDLPIMSFPMFVRSLKLFIL